MNQIACYFDNAATTPLDKDVLAAMLPFLGEEWGNPQSIHSWGNRAKEAIAQARVQVADLFGAEDPSQIFFVSCATEANNWALGQTSSLAISPFEHSSVREFAVHGKAEILSNAGWILDSAKGPAELLSVMTVNNETGAVVNLPAEITGRVHRDLTQHLGKLPVGDCLQDIDFASCSAHKIYGPKGVGALYAADPELLTPFLYGGGQESGKRGGTLNVSGIVGFGMAASIAHSRLETDRISAEMHQAVTLEALGSVSGMTLNKASTSSPYILSISFSDILGEIVVIEMDRQGFGISSGAACSSNSTEPSHVLTALGLSPELIRGTVRISFGKFNTKESSHQLGVALRKTVDSLRSSLHV